MCVHLNTRAVETGQQIAVGGQSLSGQGGERRRCRGQVGQLGDKMTRKRGTSLTGDEKNIIKSNIKLSLNTIFTSK